MITEARASTSSLDEVPLLGANFVSGAAFYLDRVAISSQRLNFGGGWDLEVKKGASVCVIRGCGLRDYSPVLESSLGAARKGLDILCAIGSGTYVLKDAVEEHVVFWPRRMSGSLAICWNATIRSGIHVSAVGVQIDGKPIPDPPVPPPHESFAHFRRSETESDLADSFRQAYLALEAILDTVETYVAGQSEGEWLRGALRTADSLCPLPPLPGRIGNETPVETAYRRWYDEERRRLFHSKPSRQSPAHLSLTDHEALIEKKYEILSFYSSLVGNLFGRSVGGSYSSVFSRSRQIEILQKQQLSYVASDDNLPAQEGVPTAARPGSQDPRVEGVGYLYASDVPVPKTRRIKRLSLSEEGTEYLWQEISVGSLELDARDILIARTTMRPSAGSFRHIFES